MARGMGLACLMVTLAVLGVWGGDSSGGDFTPQQVHIAYTGDPSSMFVTWTTSENGETGFVKYRNIFTPLAVPQQVLAKPEPIVHNGTGGDTRTDYMYKVTLTGLEPGQFYEYSVWTARGGSKREFSFATLPEGSDFGPRFAIWGDLGIGEESAAMPFLLEAAANSEYDMYIHIGDLAYELYEDLGTVGDTFFNNMEPIVANFPYMTIPGNHENRGNFSEFKQRIQSPAPNTMYNSFDVGPIHFVMINMEFYFYDEYGTGQIEAQYNWLREDLAAANQRAARAERPWIIVMGHRPMYCSCEEPGEDCNEIGSVARTGYGAEGKWPIEELLLDYGVDLYLAGHKHFYERMLPIYDYRYDDSQQHDSYHNPKYPVHVNVGIGGRESDEFTQASPSYSVVRSNDFGFISLEVLDRLTVQIQQFSVETHTFQDSFLVSKDDDYPAFA